MSRARAGRPVRHGELRGAAGDAAGERALRACQRGVHRRGQGPQGRFEAADGGTIFLDEIGEIPASTQVKLLRFLQHKEFERVGETATRKVDVRVIAATNRESGRGGQRRGVPGGSLLPAERRAAEAAAAARAAGGYPPAGPALSEEARGPRRTIARDALAALEAYPWKGNVRELENVMERARHPRAGRRSSRLHHLPEEFQTFAARTGSALSLEEMEQQHIIRVLRIAKDLDEAASMLGIDPATLWRKRKKYNL